MHLLQCSGKLSDRCLGSSNGDLKLSNLPLSSARLLYMCPVVKGGSGKGLKVFNELFSAWLFAF